MLAEIYKCEKLNTPQLLPWIVNNSAIVFNHLIRDCTVEETREFVGSCTDIVKGIEMRLNAGVPSGSVSLHFVVRI